MTKIKQTEIPLIIDDSGILQHILTERGLIENKFNWKLVRKEDGLTCESENVVFLEWGLDSKFKSVHKEAEIGRSLIMSPFNEFFTWCTTEITEIIEQKEGYLKFKTKNSTYELFKL